MAHVELVGFAELDGVFKRLGDIPWDVTNAALNKMGAVGADAVRSTGRAMGVHDPESKVHILDHVIHTKPKQTEDGGVCYVTFKGSRRRGNTKTRNAEIAFVNEYGKEGQAARPFVRQAGEQYGDEIAAPGEKDIGDWMEKTFTEG